MYKSLVILASCGAIAACTAPADSARPAASSPAQKRVCEDIEEESTGTRLGTDRVCKTVPSEKDKSPQT